MTAARSAAVIDGRWKGIGARAVAGSSTLRRDRGRWMLDGLAEDAGAGQQSPDESVVVCVTGNGYKTAEVVSGQLVEPVRLSRAFKEFEAWWESRQALA